MSKVKNIVFDYGGVLIRWNRENLYKKMFDDLDEMNWFLDNVCHMKWNEKMDLGLPFKKGVEEKIKEFPDYEKYIKAYDERWNEMRDGVIEGTVQILKDAKAKNIPCYGLSNFPGEKLKIVKEENSFFSLFNGMVVSYEEKVVKPNPEIYLRLLEKYSLKAEECVFIDDLEHNIEGAKKLGFKGIVFKSPEETRKELEALEVL